MEPLAREGKRGVMVAVHVVPRAARNEIVEPYAGALRVRLRAPPVEGAANAALIAFLAEVLQVPQRQVDVVSGRNSRKKVVAVTGLPTALVEARLLAALPPH